MSAAKHTPGPWLINSDNLRCVLAADEPCKINPELWGNSWWPEEQREPNAKLIAAAPDMAEALRKLANEVEGLGAFDISVRAAIGNTNWKILFDRLVIARAALAKAGL